VPEQTVAATGDEKGNGNLRVAMREFQHAAFLVEQPVPPLAETINAFVIKRREARFAAEKIAADRLECARGRIVCARKNLFAQRLLVVAAAGLKKAHASRVRVDCRSELPI